VSNNEEIQHVQETASRIADRAQSSEWNRANTSSNRLFLIGFGADDGLMVTVLTAVTSCKREDLEKARRFGRKSDRELEAASQASEELRFGGKLGMRAVNAGS
jgi:hypothetical protein